jgi:hypothetical protein
MRVKLPVINAINFAIIFGVLTHFANQVSPTSNLLFISNTLLNALIWMVIGGVIGFLVNFVPSHKREPTYKKHIPSKVSTKLVLIPTILLVLLIAVSAVYMSGHSPFELAGHTTAEDTEEVEVTEEIEEVVEEVVEEIDYDHSYEGVCEEKTGVEKVYIEAAGDFTHVITWGETEFGCNIKRDCLQQMDIEEDDVRCTASM